MTAAIDAPPTPSSNVHEALERACARIAPTWPLDRFIAVNPLWERVEEPLPAVSIELAALSGARLLMPRSYYREEHRAGRLRAEHLAEAIAQSGAATTIEKLVALMNSDTPSPPRRERVMDIADLQRDLAREVSWRDFVLHNLSQFCAAYFDEGQTAFRPSREGGLYATWLRHATRDRSPGLLMRARGLRALAAALPTAAAEMASTALVELDVPESERDGYLLGLLLDINGWAAWCAYRRWAARLAGRDDGHLAELLAIRLAWECLILRAGGRALRSQWQIAMAGWPSIDDAAERSQRDDWLLQRALEIAWQRDMCQRLSIKSRTGPVSPPRRASAQTVFCIDVRSEVFRRALEAQSSDVQTLGFAGFFGVPLEYAPVGSASARPQLPGLLAPRLTSVDTAVPSDLGARRAMRLDAQSSWRGFKTGAVSSFAFIEALGALAAGKLLSETFVGERGEAQQDGAGLSAWENAARKPRLPSADAGGPTVAERCALARGILRGMSVTRDFARLVVFVGHGSETRNNPYRAGLDCGACGGQTGEVNARVAAALFNEPGMRAGLAADGIEIPDDTHFIGGLHNTTTDEVTLFDVEEVPPSHVPDLLQLRSWFASAREQARRERAPGLGLAGVTGEKLRRATVARATSWSQVRPEWGLAGNAAFIVAPRARSRHVDLAGRAFLHEYRHEDDGDGTILEAIMTAPMVVTHWINFQYYASTVDNKRYGSGNKVLHNVVGGHLGVFEGNGGDLRIGLPLQSLHDGGRWVHTPLRLSVFIEAPRTSIEAVLKKHDKIRALVEGEWLWLFQIEPATGGVSARLNGRWERH
jgi:uncharacterized protein YbcC (UPF0753/DUF2309 family)